jgi:hypothetical protein
MASARGDVDSRGLVASPRLSVEDYPRSADSDASCTPRIALISSVDRVSLTAGYGILSVGANRQRQRERPTPKIPRGSR